MIPSTMRPHRRTLISLVKGWMTPLAPQPEAAFQERVIRISALVLVGLSALLLIPILLALGGLIANPNNLVKPDHARLIAFLLLVGVAVGALVHFRQVALAGGVILTGPAYIMISAFLNNGYWSALAPFGSLTMLLIAVLVLPRRRLWGVVGAVAILTLACIALREAGVGSADWPYDRANPPNTLDIMFNPITAGVLHLVFIFAAGLIINYYVSELERRRATLDNLVGQLEQHVSERTRDVEAARDEAQTLYRLGHDMNAATTYTGLIDVVAGYFNRPEANISLSVFDTFDKVTAQNFSVIALRRAGTHGAINPSMTFPAGWISPWTDNPIFDVQDIDAPGILDTLTADFFRNNQARAFTITRIKLGQRIVGLFTVTWPTPHTTSAAERRFILSTTDLVAATIERLRLFDEQVRATEQLRALDQLKSQFLASMSHELRTPLNAILNFTEFVALGLLGAVNEKQADALNKALESSRHLLSLINDVLDMTKIEAGMIKLFVEDNIVLHEEFKQVIAATQALLRHKPEVQLVLDIDENLPPLLGDRRRVRQILLNLLSNAVKFTQRGTITFSAKRRDPDVLFAVIDTGPGIAPQDHALIFEPFRQTEHGLQYGAGTGLGLSISYRLVEAHGGKLWVESEPGEGAAFYVQMPLRFADLLMQMEG